MVLLYFLVITVFLSTFTKYMIVIAKVRVESLLSVGVAELDTVLQLMLQDNTFYSMLTK